MVPLAGHGSLGMVLEGWVSHEGLANVFQECYEHNEGLVRPETESLDFSCLCTPLYTPILSPPSTRYLYYYHVPSS